MATINEVRVDVYERFNTLWASRTPFTFDNESFTPPDADEAWVRLTVRSIASDQETLGHIGNRKFLREGQIFVQVFTALDEGLETSDTLVEAVRTIFEGERFGDVWVYETGSREIGSDGLYYQVNVVSRFFYDMIK